MRFSVDDTIAAIGSARGGAARGILRVSGPGAAACVDRCFVADDSQSLADRPIAAVAPGRWRLSLDESPRLPGELYWWPGRRSYTREPTVEFHTLGSPPLLDAALESVCAAGARPARPGEFTLRAFLAGRLDLTQAEAVLGVIDAAGPAQLHVALAQLAGGLAEPLHRLRDQLLDLLARVEAGLDFVTEDIEFISAAELTAELSKARDFVDSLARRMEGRTSVQDEPTVVLAGLPNAGKSSLFNALCGDSAAIVADVAGTTRDYVTRRTKFGGQACQLVDTAGWEATSPDRPLEQAAQEAAERQRAQAAVELYCLDGASPPTDADRRRLSEPPPTGAVRIVVLTKCDDSPDPAGVESLESLAVLHAARRIATSAKTSRGLDELQEAIAQALASRPAAAEGAVAATAVRCRESLRRAAEGLQQALDFVPTGEEELVAAELRLALDELGEVAGAVYTDDLLDRIFSRFCIGK